MDQPFLQVAQLVQSYREIPTTCDIPDGSLCESKTVHHNVFLHHFWIFPNPHQIVEKGSVCGNDSALYFDALLCMLGAGELQI